MLQNKNSHAGIRVMSRNKSRQSAEKDSRNVENSAADEEMKPRSRRDIKRKAGIARWMVVDLVIAGLLFLGFALYYFIIPRDLSKDAIALPAPQNVQAAQKNGGQAQNPAADPKSWRVKFAGKFTKGNVVKTDTSYTSANININIQKKIVDKAACYIADIYVADIKSFRTAFASGKYASGSGLPTDKIAQANNAIIAINGDNSPENVGPIVRNGQLYKNKVILDALVMNNDGSMQTYSPQNFDVNKLMKEGAWQAWTFGPMLLKDGQQTDTFNSSVKVANPRSAIGYYEPGHYCFVVVDGRQPGYSEGLSCQQMSRLFYSMGCKTAFNLDGGQSTEMAFMGKLVNKPYNGGRPINDIVYIAD